MGTGHQHRICTFDEAEKAIKAHKHIYVNDCGCRKPAKEGKTPYKYCGHPIETCMGFRKPNAKNAEQWKYKEITRKQALARFEDWKKQGNFFRFMEDANWICFCCECGCGWLRDKKGKKVEDTCDKSPYIEKTDSDKCTICGTCIDVCAHHARTIKSDKMVVSSKKCYGCSACEYICPEKAIKMEFRKK
ncbi:MAG: 4Fe-4S dicluster domain-containing protein [Planctomycetota bacterium]